MGGMTILYNEYQNPNLVLEKMVTIGSPFWISMKY